MKKRMTRAMHSACATAMALTLAIPVSAGMKMNIVAAEETDPDSILGRAVVTYDFEDGGESLDFEGEEYLLLEDSGEVDASGNAIKLPVINEAGDDYVKVRSEALPEVVEDEEKGNVLRFKDSVKVDKYVKEKSDALDDKYKVTEYLQTDEKIGGRVHLENPYKGKTLEGVTISYWVKVPTVVSQENPDSNYKGGKEIGANSTTVVFNNESRYTIQRDDYMKHLACMAYDEFKDNALLDKVELVEGFKGNEEEQERLVIKREDFNQGTQEIVSVRDSDGKVTNTYILYSDYGKLVRLSPEYPKTEVNGEKPTVGGGWYAPSDAFANDRKIAAEKSDGSTVGIASLATGTTVDTAQYPLFRYFYKANPASGQAAEIVEAEEKKLNDDGYSSKSKIRDGYIRGSMQITTDNDFGFREDSYRTDSYTDANGVVQNPAVAGCKVTNPNSDYFGKFQNFHGDNQFYFDGDEFVTQGKEEDEVYDEDEGDYVARPAIKGADVWHYVSIVIENDWVQTYVDGVAADVIDAGDYQYLKDLKNVPNHNFNGKDVNNGKEFNQGIGIRGIYRMKGNITDWTSYGTLSSNPGNASATTMLGWLADENTELYLGGTGVCSEMLTQGYGTVDGVCLDDVSFFDEALSKEEAIQLYMEARKAKGGVMLGDVNGDEIIDTDDALEVLKYSLGMDVVPEFIEEAAYVTDDDVIDTDDALEILKYALGMDSVLK